MNDPFLPLIRPQDIPVEKIPLGLVTPHARALLHAMRFEWVSVDKDRQGHHLFVKQTNETGVDSSRQFRISVAAEGNTDTVMEAIYDAGSEAKRVMIAEKWTALQGAVNGKEVG